MNEAKMSISLKTLFQTQATDTVKIQVSESLEESTGIKLSDDHEKINRRQHTLVDTVRRTNSEQLFPSSLTRYYIVREGKLIEQKSTNLSNTCFNSVLERRITIDNLSYAFNQNISPSVYPTSTRQEQDDRHRASNENSAIQLAMDTQLPVNHRDDMRLEVSTENNTDLELTIEKSEVNMAFISNFFPKEIVI
jgi:hypothetical protein